MVAGEQMARRFAQVCLEGADAAAFLQGYLTADMDALRADVALPVACCNLKGRVVASGWASGEPHRVRLLWAESAVDAFATHLRKYLLFSKSQLSTAMQGVRFSPQRGNGAVELPPTGWHATFDVGDEAHAEFANACVSAGFVAVAAPVVDAFLPQMVGLTDAGAVSFAKGCYLGQEVVARAQHRGQVKQTLRSYRLAGAPPPVGAEVMGDRGKIGVLVATAGERALAVTRSNESPVTVAGCRLTLA